MQKGTCIICSAVTDAQWHVIVNITNPNFWHSRFSTLQERQVLTLGICSCFHFKQTVPSTGPASLIQPKASEEESKADRCWRCVETTEQGISFSRPPWRRRDDTDFLSDTYILCRVPVSCPLPAPIPRLDLLDLTFPPFAFALGPRFVSVRLVTRRRPPST